MPRTSVITISLYDGLSPETAMLYAREMVRKFTTEDEATGSDSVAYTWISPVTDKVYIGGIVERTKSGNLSVRVEGSGNRDA